MTQPIRLAVIDDHPLFREGVTRSLVEVGGFEVVGEGSTTEDAVRLARQTSPDIVLLDISMPGGGLNAIAPILSHRPSQKIVLLTASEDSEDLAAALNGGAQGYVLKGVGAYLSSLWMTEVGQRVVHDLRGTLFRHILNQSAAYFSGQTTGRLPKDALAMATGVLILLVILTALVAAVIGLLKAVF